MVFLISLLLFFIQTPNIKADISKNSSQNIAVDVKVIEENISDDKVFLHPEIYQWNELPFSRYSLPPFSKKTWYKITIKASRGTIKVLRFNYELIPDLDIYVRSSLSNSIEEYHLGTNILPTKDAKKVILSFQKGEQKEIYYCVFGNGGSASSDPEIVEINNTSEEIKSDLLIIGRTLTILFFSLSLLFYFYSKKLEYIYLCIYLIGVSLFAETEAGTFLGYITISDVDISYLMRFIGNHCFVFALVYFFKSLLQVTFAKNILRLLWSLNIIVFLVYTLFLVLSSYSFVWGLSYYIVIGISYVCAFFLPLNIIVPAYRHKQQLMKQSAVVMFLIILIFFLFITAPHLGLYERNYYSSFYIYLNGVLCSFLFIYLLILNVIYTHKENKRLLMIEKKFQEEYLQAIITSQKEERTKISEEIHSTIQKDLQRIEEESQQFEGDVQEVIQHTIKHVHKISKSLKTPTIRKENWIHKVTELTESFSTNNCTFHFHSSFKQLPLSEKSLSHLYHIINELYVNAIKHSSAQKVSLNITKIKNHIFIEYQDNGVGINKETLKNGIGLRNINQRILVMNGSLDINSEQHLRIIITLPIHNSTSQN